MRSGTEGGPAALAATAFAGRAARRDGTTLTKVHDAVAGAATTCGWSCWSRTSVVEPVTVFVSQHVRRAWPGEEGGQQHRFSAFARIVGQESAAATEVVTRAPTTKSAKSRRIEARCMAAARGARTRALSSPVATRPRFPKTVTRSRPQASWVSTKRAGVVRERRSRKRRVSRCSTVREERVESWPRLTAAAERLQPHHKQ
jgi:hypothetical protein